MEHARLLRHHGRVPQTATPPDVDVRRILRNLPPWVVVLHNDDHNSMDHVVKALLDSVPALSEERAIEIMYAAHNHGSAIVISCPKETAEHYRERLESFGLTATIEEARGPASRWP
jgi:ATP-dependent Clp protease adaptor protein ClpS